MPGAQIVVAGNTYVTDRLCEARIDVAPGTIVAQLRLEFRRLTVREPIGRHWAGHVLAVADRLGEYAAQSGPRERRRGAADAAGVLDDRRGPGA